MPSKTKLLALLLLVLTHSIALANRSENSPSNRLEVTGSSVEAPFLRELFLQRGWPIDRLPNRPLKPGQSWSLADGSTRVVCNIDWRPPEPAVAALSDHPEKVTRRGMLFSGGLSKLRPVRFQYYHLGLLKGSSPHLNLYVTNSGARPAKLHFQSGVGRPSGNYFATGHGNNVEWFRVQQQNLGHFVDLEPGETRSLLHQPLPFELVVSGLTQLTQVEGPPLYFYLVASPNPEPLALNNLLDPDDVHSRGFYPVAVQEMTSVYRGSPTPVTIPVGAVYQPTFAGVRELRGDYGIVYRIAFRWENPSPEPRTYEMVFNPRGGVATGTFLLSTGELIEVSQTAAFEERAFFRKELAPFETFEAVLRTVPEGASSYPIRILFRAVEGDTNGETP